MAGTFRVWSIMSFEMTVYILRCADGSYYVGSTKQEIEARVWEHNNLPWAGYTASRRPVTLVFTETYERITDAIARERQLKGWSRREKGSGDRLGLRGFAAAFAPWSFGSKRVLIGASFEASPQPFGPMTRTSG
jgi:putative endonuclease